MSPFTSIIYIKKHWSSITISKMITTTKKKAVRKRGTLTFYVSHFITLGKSLPVFTNFHRHNFPNDFYNT